MTNKGRARHSDKNYKSRKKTAGKDMRLAEDESRSSCEVQSERSSGEVPGAKGRQVPSVPGNVPSVHGVGVLEGNGGRGLASGTRCLCGTVTVTEQHWRDLEGLELEG